MMYSISSISATSKNEEIEYTCSLKSYLRIPVSKSGSIYHNT